MTDTYLDPTTADHEVACRSCGMHQGECEGPPLLCCPRCEHWDPDELASDHEQEEAA